MKIQTRWRVSFTHGKKIIFIWHEIIRILSCPSSLCPEKLSKHVLDKLRLDGSNISVSKSKRYWHRLKSKHILSNIRKNTHKNIKHQNKAKLLITQLWQNHPIPLLITSLYHEQSTNTKKRRKIHIINDYLQNNN